MDNLAENSIDVKDLFWLAGLLEGEGSFLKPPPSDLKRPRIKISMTDADVIKRVNQLFAVDYYYTRRTLRKAHWKTEYSTILRGKRANVLMSQLYPLMGERRRSQIQAAIGFVPMTETIPNRDLWFYWLAGLLEGEGSFLPGPPTESNKIRIQITMTDKDVLERTAQLIRVRVKGPYTRTNSSTQFKPHYMAVCKGKNAADLMRSLYPLMGNRRQQQILKAFESYFPNREYGNNHPQAKLTEEKVRVIRGKIEGGEPLHQIALEYGVDTSLIWQIKARRIWKHIE